MNTKTISTLFGAIFVGVFCSIGAPKSEERIKEHREARLFKRLKNLPLGGTRHQRVSFFVISLTKLNPVGAPRYVSHGIRRLPGRHPSKGDAQLAYRAYKIVKKSKLSPQKKAKVMNAIQKALIIEPTPTPTPKEAEQGAAANP